MSANQASCISHVNLQENHEVTDVYPVSLELVYEAVKKSCTSSPKSIARFWSRKNDSALRENKLH